MGSCLSLGGAGESSSWPTAKVVQLNGTIQEFFSGVVVEHILHSNPGCFVCDSDSMCYDEPILAMSPTDYLQSDRLYFVLPTTKLSQPLAASDMAALAVKASQAMQLNNNKKKLRSVRVMPVCASPSRQGYEELKKEHEFQRNASFNRKLGSRRFKGKLSTIHEDHTCS